MEMEAITAYHTFNPLKVIMDCFDELAAEGPGELNYALLSRTPRVLFLVVRYGFEGLQVGYNK